MAKRAPRPRASETAQEEITQNTSKPKRVATETASEEISALPPLVAQAIETQTKLKTQRRAPRDRAAPLSPKLAQQLVPYHWKPGQSGNPGGRPRIESEVRRLAQENSPVAMTRLIEIAAKSRDERAAIIASQTILDRAFGPAKEPPPEDVTRDKPDLEELGTKDLKALRAILRKIVAGGAKG